MSGRWIFLVFIFEFCHGIEPAEFINMTIWQRRLRLCVLTVVPFLATPILARSETGAEEAVRAVLERQVGDWNRGDLDAFLNGYWKSPKLVFQSGGQRYDGWEAMPQTLSRSVSGRAANHGPARVLFARCRVARS